ncbi:hypothetical protein Taro_035022 [Colocasia esculenta]|uniref:Uncharacterized protein n=1 Tax=Colocasia esculenta TaxID=4460 RepID=A0A843W9B2_COLES|nr:hypothetical protein [Colocasia esculenta]
MIGLQFWEEQPWEGFVGGISCWSFLCPSSCSSSCWSFLCPSSCSSSYWSFLCVSSCSSSCPSSVSPPVAAQLTNSYLYRAIIDSCVVRTRKNAQKVCQSADPTLWRKRAPTWMRRDYWESLCNIWATERWQQTSTTMKVNREANPEANMHTSGSISFATHQSRLEKELKRPPTFQEVFDKTHKKKGTDQYIRYRAREVASYSQQMIEKYVGEEEQPQLDPEVWVAASGAPKKGHVYGFGHSMDTSRVLSGASSSAS